MVLHDKEILEIAFNTLRVKIQESTRQAMPAIESVVLIGSCVYPETTRKNSDIDLVLLVEDGFAGNFQEFKMNYRFPLDYPGNPAETPGIDALVYTVTSFKNEMAFGSLTRVFAILNAFRVLHSQNQLVEAILTLAEQRMQASVDLAKEELSQLSIDWELENLRNYYEVALSVLTSEKTSSDHLLVHLRLSEYLKELIIQFQRLVFASDIQQGRLNETLNRSIRNLLVFNNADGTRLLNPRKYYMDPRVIAFIRSMNAILSENNDLHLEIYSLFTEIDKAFVRQLNTSLSEKENKKPFYKLQKIAYL